MIRSFLAALFLMVLGAVAQETSAASPDCINAPYQSAETADQRRLVIHVAALRDALRDFPALLAVLDSRRPSFCISGGLIEAMAYYEPDSNRILLASGTEAGLTLAILVHEIRHLHQFDAGICPSDRLAMREYARGVFALEADANVVSLLVAWHARSGGEPGMWQALENWSMTADIAARFADSMTATGDVSDAAASAFDQWYALGIRREKYYVAACSDYLERSDRTHALPSYRLLPTDFLTRVCLMPGGTPYPCVEGNDAFTR